MLKKNLLEKINMAKCKHCVEAVAPKFNVRFRPATWQRYSEPIVP